MKIRKDIYGKIGIINGWNKVLNGKICIIVSEKNISYNKRYDICKVLVDDKIYTVPKYFISICKNMNVEL